MSHCEKKSALKAWKQYGSVKLSWLAMNAVSPLDLDDKRHKIDVSTWKDGSKACRIINQDGSVPEIYLRRVIT